MGLFDLFRKTRKVKPRIDIVSGKKQCHPRVKNVEQGCLPVSVLEKVSRRIGIKTRRNLMNSVAEKLKVNPENQNSLVKALPIPDEEKQEIMKKWLRPAQPESWKNDPDAWLDTNNIQDVMKQYEESHSNFKFFGAVPIDFSAADPYSKKKQCLIKEICEIDFDGDALEGKDYIGIVFNLDPHYKSGSHWVASFINIPKKEYYYFDSYGMKPPSQIYKFMQWLTIQEPDMKLKMNAKRFQRKESECGMFCIYFIIRMLEGESFEDFCARNPSDDLMLEMRKEVYSS
jgi:hypothetical protein